MLQSTAACAALLMLAGCNIQRSSVVVEPSTHSTIRPVSSIATVAPGGSYRVMQGDTLYSIAFRNGVDFRALASWNDIAAPYTIWPGEMLKLGAPGSIMPAPARLPAPVHSTAVVTPPPTRPVVSAAVPATPMFEPISAASSAASALGQPTPVTPSTLPNAAPGVASSESGAGVVPATHVPITPGSMTPVPIVPVAGVPKPPASLPPPEPVVAAPNGAVRVASGIAWRWPADGALIKRFRSGDAIPGIELSGRSGDSVRAAAAGVVVYSGNGLVGYGELIIIKHSDSFLSAYGHNRKRMVKEGQRVSAGQQVAEMGSTGASRDELQFQIRLNGNPVDPLSYLPPR